MNIHHIFLINNLLLTNMKISIVLDVNLVDLKNVLILSQNLHEKVLLRKFVGEGVTWCVIHADLFLLMIPFLFVLTHSNRILPLCWTCDLVNS